MHKFTSPHGWTGTGLSSDLARIAAFLKWWDYGKPRGYPF